MKKILTFSILMILVMSCSQDSVRNNNPYLPTYRFQSSAINLNLPLYQNLLNAGNPIEYYEAGVGIQGKVFIMNTGGNVFIAFDAVCPNQEISGCSTMDLVGIKAECPCDDAQYSLFTGQSPEMQYPMLQYRVEVLSSTSIRVYN